LTDAGHDGVGDGVDQSESATARSYRCSACGLRHTGEHECPESPEYHGKWEWNADHYDEIAVRVDQGGGCISWFRKLHTSGPTRWHKIVPHPDGSPRDHWLCQDDEFFAAYIRAVDAKAVPVGESPFADQELYDELAKKNGQTRAIIQTHMNRLGEGVDDGE